MRPSLPIVLMSDWLNQTRPARMMERAILNAFRNRNRRPSTLPSIEVGPVPRRALGVGAPGGFLMPLRRTGTSLVPLTTPQVPQESRSVLREAAAYALNRLADRLEGGRARTTPGQGRQILRRILNRGTQGGISGRSGR